MNNLEEIQCILWHEIGHFLIDLFLIEMHPEISVTEILIRNYECESVNWCGWVSLEPRANLKYEEVIKDLSLTAFKFLSLPSGCFFQAQNAPDKLAFKDCFSFKKTAVGKSDHDNFWELDFQLRNSYELNDNDKKAFFQGLNDIVFEKYFREINKLEGFQKELKKVIEREANVILSDYASKKEPQNYSFKFEEKYLSNLSEELTSLMIEYGFGELVVNLHLEIIQHIKKYLKITQSP